MKRQIFFDKNLKKRFIFGLYAQEINAGTSRIAAENHEKK